MKTFKKLGLGILVTLGLLCVGLLGANDSLAAGIVGFSTSDLQAISSSGSTFQFKDKSTVVGSIKRAKDGKTYPVTFVGPSNPTALNTPYPFTNQDGSFCEPDSSVIPTGTIRQSIIYVEFTSFNGPIGKIVPFDPTGQSSHLWPGVDSLLKNGASDCGIKKSDGKYYPVNVSQTSVTAGGNPTGTGSEYTKAVVASAKYKFLNSGVIQMSFSAKATDGKIPAAINLVDSQPYDTTYQYVSQALFCNGNGGGRAMKITLNGSIVSSSVAAGFSGSGDQASFFDGSTCIVDSSQWPASISITNPTNSLADKSTARLVQEVAQWDKDSSGNPVINLLTCGPDGTCSADIPLSLVSGAYVQNTNGCQGYTLTLNSGSSYQGKLQKYSGNSCTLSGGDTRSAVAILGTKGQAPTCTNGATNPPTCDNNTGGATGNDEGTCELNAAGIAGSAESYFMCPMLAAADDTASGLTSEISSLLNFDVGSTFGNGNNPTRQAWSNLRDLSSVLLVIIMLVMVISQAVSWGPFDAYTVRKILPKLVAAVIFMQISWSLLDYVIGLANSFGNGIADLLYGPFGGSSALQLGNILHNAGVGTGEAGAISWVALLSVGAIAVLSLPTLLLMGWSVVLALAVGFVVLTFRQILIIASLIFAPLAILCWILPGTQRYWKLWYDNFTKLLIMFPMITGMLAVGKIFAYITGIQDHGGSLVTFMFILIGFFGPYFLLSKTYKWGGQALGALSTAASNAAPKLGGPVTNYLKGTQERSKWHQAREARKTELGRAAKEEYAQGLISGSRFQPAFVHRSRLLGATKNRRVVDRGIASARAEREKVLQEQANERLAPMIEEAAQTGDWGNILGMAATGTPQEREVAIAQMIKSRRWGELTTYRQSQGANTADWDRTLAKNGELAGTLDEKRADLLAGPSRPITRVIAGGDIAVDRATGLPRFDPVTRQPVINTGLTPGQLVQQHATFWTAAGQAIGTASDEEVRGAYDRMQLMARDPRALQLVGGAGETGANQVLSEYQRRFRTGAGTLRELVEQQRIPPPGAAGPAAPTAGGGGGGIFTPPAGSVGTPI